VDRHQLSCGFYFVFVIISSPRNRLHIGLRLCICKHCGPHWPFGISAPVWYLSDKKWRYGFEQYEEVPVWHTVPYPNPAPPIIAPCLLWPNGRPSQLLLSSCVSCSECIEVLRSTSVEVLFHYKIIATMSPGPRQLFGHNRLGPKIGEGAPSPFLERGSCVPI